MPPEMYFTGLYDQRADIWALGCVIIMIIADKNELKQAGFLNNVLCAIISAPAERERLLNFVAERLPTRYTKGLVGLLSRTLELDPTLRPTTYELVQDPFFMETFRPASSAVLNVGFTAASLRESPQ